MIKIGKISKINISANKLIKKQCDELKIFECEIKLQGCWGSADLHPAHKHKRVWYRPCPDLLSDFNQWVLACPNCHEKIEYDKNLTLQIFKRLRPKTTTMPVKQKPISKREEKRNKKAEWMRPHKCIHCHKMLTGLFCSCGELSTK